ncbi:MAG TPA: SsrA-binding protein [Cyanobacteria bacterium UBA8530]|nr:SsrA-binding protein [Cyanobacteria bacterium UBA8530]
MIADNKRAFHEYHILEQLEVGIELTGTEVKSLRMGKVSIADSFARIDKGEVILHHLFISPYVHGNRFNHDPLRPRRLLLHRKEINTLIGKTKEQGLTLVPLKLYWDGDWAKLLLGLAKGKKLYDKREALAGKEHQREIERALKERTKLS